MNIKNQKKYYVNGARWRDTFFMLIIITSFNSGTVNNCKSFERYILPKNKMRIKF